MKDPEMKDRPVAHEQAEILLLMEAKYTERFAHLDPASSGSAHSDAPALWREAIRALTVRYLAAGGTLDEIESRFTKAQVPFKGRFFFSSH